MIVSEDSSRVSNNSELFVLIVFNSNCDSMLLLNQVVETSPAASRKSEFWFPFQERPDSTRTVAESVEDILDNLESENCRNLKMVESYVGTNKCLSVKLMRIYTTSCLPSSTIATTYPSRLYYFVCRLNETCKLNYLRDNSRLNPNEIVNDNNARSNLKWFDYEQLVEYQRKHLLLGLEPVLAFKKFAVDKHEIENTAEDLFYEPKMIYYGEGQTPIDQLISSARFTKEIQTKIAEFYFQHSFPSEFLCLSRFSSMMNKLFGLMSSSVDERRMSSYFHAFDSTQKCMLTFGELLMGLAAMEPFTQHGGAPAEQRCRYIFRFYSFNEFDSSQCSESSSNNSTSSILMTFDQFRAMVQDINILRKGVKVDIDKEALMGYKSFGVNDPTEKLSMADFLIGVGQLKFRGTSILLRFTKPINDLLGLLCNEPESIQNLINNFGLHNKLVRPLKLDNKQDFYELAYHSVKVKRSGTIAEFAAVWDIEGAATPTVKELFNDKPQFGRNESIDFFNQKTHPNEMLNGLRYYERAIKETKNNETHMIKDSFDWGKVEMSSMAKCLIQICRTVKEIVANESRLLQISAPCYILGDIHGNFRDLICFEKTLWRMGAMLTPASFLFLGDYVDRGPEGIEVVSYLFTQKILCPNKFFLLRGNHEIRHIQRQYTFYNECKIKFGDVLGEQIWDEINEVFDHLPLAAVVDNKIFCIHGGIPSSANRVTRLDEISQIKSPLRDIERESILAWEILWNDPLAPEYEIDINELKENNGFVHNSRRGTAHFFSNDALNDFLKENNLLYVVRAHEVQQSGFKIQLGGHLLTVFSSSGYCGGSNEAATVLVDSNKLRLIRLDTRS